MFGKVLGCVAALAVLVGGWATAVAAPQDSTSAKPGEGKRAQEFIAAFNRGDAKAVAAFWTPDATYVDQTGREVKGRAALEKMYAAEFAALKGAKLTITVQSARLLSPDVAIEEGMTEVSSPNGGPPTVAKFVAVLVKKDGEWFFDRVQDSVAHPPTNAVHFEDLEALIGDWAGETAKGEMMHASFSWAENQNFIVNRMTTTLGGHPVTGATQWIAWDAVEKRVCSWTFYSGGGIGEAIWTKEGNKWTVKMSGKSADGKKITATNVITIVDANNVTWQPTNITVDGKQMPDRPPIKLKRG